jgi:hypothetical protein
VRGLAKAHFLIFLKGALTLRFGLSCTKNCGLGQVAPARSATSHNRNTNNHVNSYVCMYINTPSPIALRFQRHIQLRPLHIDNIASLAGATLLATLVRSCFPRHEEKPRAPLRSPWSPVFLNTSKGGRRAASIINLLVNNTGRVEGNRELYR